MEKENKEKKTEDEIIQEKATIAANLAIAEKDRIDKTNAAAEMLEKTNDAAIRLEAANKERQRLVDEAQSKEVKDSVAGTIEAGTEKKKMNDQEYAEAYDRGEVDPFEVKK